MQAVPWRLLLRIGIRNLLRHRRRNGLLLASVITAVASVTFLNALMRGIQTDMLARVRENLNGDWLVVAKGYRDDPGLQQAFIPDSAALEAIQALPGLRVATRIRTPVVMMSERDTRGAELIGIDPGHEVPSFLDHVQYEGNPVADKTTDGVVLGRALAEDLRTRIGKRVVLVMRDGSGHSRESGIRVIGLFDADGTSLERRYAFTGRETLTRLLPPGALTEISLSGSLPAHADVHELLDHVAPGLDIRSWREVEPQVAVMFDLLDSVMWVWFGIIMAALGFGLVNALVTSIMERRREFGVVRCLGMSQSSLLLQVVLESGALMLTGALLGSLLGVLLVGMTGGSIDLGQFARGLDLAGYGSRISIIIEVHDLVNVALMSLVFGALASLLPAMRINRLPLLMAVAR